jgi:hypothetical protein
MRQAGMPTGSKVLVGCGMAFGLGLLASLGGGVYAMWWAFSPGRQAPTSVVVGPRSVGYVRLERAATDPGVRALFRKVITETERAQDARAPVPPPLDVLRGVGRAYRQFDVMLPREATVSLEPVPGRAQPQAVGAANFVRFVRPVAFGMVRAASANGRVVPHRGYEVISARGGFGFCFAGGTFLFAQQSGSLPAVIDDIESGRAVPALPPPVEGDWDVHGTLRDPLAARAFAAWLLPRDEDPSRLEPAFAGLESVRFGWDVETADSMDATVALDYADARAASEARDALDAALAARQAEATAEGVELTTAALTRERSVVLVGAATGLERALERWIAAAAARRRPR